MRHKCPKAGKATAKGEPPLRIASTPTLEGLAQQIWLHYFNDYLLKRQVITEEEWRKLRRLIGEN